MIQLDDVVVVHVDVLHIAKALSIQANALTHALITGKSWLCMYESSVCTSHTAY